MKKPRRGGVLSYRKEPRPFMRLTTIAIALVIGVFLSFTSSRADASSDTYGLDVELIVNEQLFLYFERLTTEGRKKSHRENPPSVGLPVLVNGRLVATLRFGIQRLTDRNRDLGQQAFNGDIWVTRAPVFDITSYIKRPWAFLNSATNVVKLGFPEWDADTLDSAFILGTYIEQNKRDAEEMVAGGKRRFGVPFARITVLRNGRPTVEGVVLLRIEKFRETSPSWEASMELIDDEISFPVGE